LYTPKKSNSKGSSLPPLQVDIFVRFVVVGGIVPVITLAGLLFDCQVDKSISSSDYVDSFVEKHEKLFHKMCLAKQEGSGTNHRYNSILLN
jgi:hypothetical protein